MFCLVQFENHLEINSQNCCRCCCFLKIQWNAFNLPIYSYCVSLPCLDPKIKPKLLLIAVKIKLPRRDSQTCQVCQTTNERDCASSHPSAEGLLNTLNPAAPFSWPRWVRQGQGGVCKPMIPRKPGPRIGIKDQLVQRSGLVWCFEDGAGGDLVVLKPGYRARVMGRKQTSHRDAGGIGWSEMGGTTERCVRCFCAHPLTLEFI